jgi:hypothetical protein
VELIKAPRLLSLLFLLFFSFFISLDGFAAIDPGVIQGNIDDIAKTVLTYFPKVHGTVTSVDDETVVVNLGKEKGVTKGVLLTVYRDKEPFHHPVTGVQLGRFEEEVGTIEVDQVEGDHLRARTISPGRSIRAGDSVRISAARIPVGVTSLSPDGPDFLTTELVSALSETGRFRVDLLPAQASPSDALKRNKLYLIRLTTSKEEGRFLMKLEIQNTQTGKSLSEMTVHVVQSEESDLILEHLQYQLFQRQQDQSN